MILRIKTCVRTCDRSLITNKRKEKWNISDRNINMNIFCDILLHANTHAPTDFAKCMVLHRCKVKGIIGKLVSYRYGLGAYKSTAELWKIGKVFEAFSMTIFAILLVLIPNSYSTLSQWMNDQEPPTQLHFGPEQSKIQTYVLGQSLVCLLAPLTHLLALHCSLRWRAPLCSFIHSPAHSLTPNLMGKWMNRCLKTDWICPIVRCWYDDDEE